MRFLAYVGALVVALAIIAGGYFFGGFYSVAASATDADVVKWALTQVREASIARHDAGKPPIALDDPTTIQEGARRFAQHGCVHCHGGPGAPWSKFSEGLNPGPPDLKDVANGRSATAIFWIVRNGIRMTGMPSFANAGLDDTQVWQIAAFVKKLPSVSEADYRSWTAAKPQ